MSSAVGHQIRSRPPSIVPSVPISDVDDLAARSSWPSGGVGAAPMSNVPNDVSGRRTDRTRFPSGSARFAIEPYGSCRGGDCNARSERRRVGRVRRRTRRARTPGRGGSSRPSSFRAGCRSGARRPSVLSTIQRSPSSRSVSTMPSTEVQNAARSSGVGESKVTRSNDTGMSRLYGRRPWSAGWLGAVVAALATVAAACSGSDRRLSGRDRSRRGADVRGDRPTAEVATTAADDSTTTSTTPPVEDGPLGDVCPPTIAIQTASLPGPAVGPLYLLLGSDPIVDVATQRVSAPLVRVDGTVEDVDARDPLGRAGGRLPQPARAARRGFRICCSRRCRPPSQPVTPPNVPRSAS